MINLNNIKTILQIAGITYLRIDFGNDQKHVKAYYVFKGVSGIKQITYQEIINALTIGLPEVLAGSNGEERQELR